MCMLKEVPGQCSICMMISKGKTAVPSSLPQQLPSPTLLTYDTDIMRWVPQNYRGIPRCQSHRSLHVGGIIEVMVQKVSLCLLFRMKPLALK